MFGLTGLPLYIGAGALIIIVILSGALWVQTNRVQAKNETIAALKLTTEAWEQKVAVKDARITSLMTTVQEQSDAVIEAARLGVIADQKQREVDILQGELAQAKGDLQVIAEAYRNLRENAVGLNACQTYELVLRSVAGSTP